MKSRAQLILAIVLPLLIATSIFLSSNIEQVLKMSLGWPYGPSVWITLLSIASFCFLTGIIVILRQAKNEWESLETKMKFAVGFFCVILGGIWLVNSMKMLFVR